LFVKEGGSCVHSGFFELARGGVEEGRVSLANNVGVLSLMMAYTQAPKMKISSSLKLMKVPCSHRS
jgi:hypothetical protein